MMVEIVSGHKISTEILQRYFKRLVDQFFKILPLREEGEPTLVEYMEGLRAELLGLDGLFMSVDNDPMLLSLLSILQYLIDNPDVPHRVYKREVFSAISTCNKLKARYCVPTEVNSHESVETL